MPRPPKCRWVGDFPQGIIFKPLGFPFCDLQTIEIQLDELEALRQAHLYNKSQEEGAEALGISRSTFGRILESAHQKMTRALTQPCAFSINGGPIIMNKRQFSCRDCGHSWEVPFGTSRPGECPSCHSHNFQRSDAGPRQLGRCGGGANPRLRGRGQGRR